MSRISAGNTKINIYFNDQVLDALKKMALSRGTTYSELIREATRAFVLKEAPKILDEAKTIKGYAK